MDPATYVANAAAMWTGLATTSRRAPRYVRADLSASTRFILTGPGAAAAVPGLIAQAPAASKVTVEDPWGGPAPHGWDARRMALMIRPPQEQQEQQEHHGQHGQQEQQEPNRSGIRVTRVDRPDELARAERVMVDGFPLRAFQPLTRGAALPSRLLDTPGWDVWLAYRNDEPAAAGYTYDDGRAVGVYWLATLPDHRSAGMGRAVLSTALATGPNRPWTLVATDAGRPLYESLGFVTVSTAHWYSRN